MGEKIQFAEIMSWPGGWDSFPSLDDLHTGTGAQRQKARESAQELKEGILRYCVQREIPLISLEISALDRRRDEFGQMAFTTYFFAHRSLSVVFPSENSNQSKGRQSPYSLAMQSMLNRQPGLRGSNAAPILFHPDLRDPNVAFVRGGPLQDPELGQSSGAGMVWAGPTLTELSDFKTLGARHFQAKETRDHETGVEQQVDNFLHFLVEHVRALAADNRGLQTRLYPIAEYLEQSSLLVFPFMRDSGRLDEPGERLVDAAAYGEAISGVFFFALIGPKLAPEPDEAALLVPEESERDKVQLLADYLSRLCLGLALGEQQSAVQQLRRHGEIVEDAAHDIVNLIKSFPAQMVFDHLFDKPPGGHELSVDDLMWYPMTDSRNVPEGEAAQDAEKMLGLYKRHRRTSHRILTQLRMLELANGPTHIKEKHQNDKLGEYADGFYLLEAIKLAINYVNSEPEIEGLNRTVEPNFIVVQDDTKGNEIWLPPEYISIDFVVEELFELFLNSARHGHVEANKVHVDVVLSFDSKSRHSFAKLRIANRTGVRIQKVSNKRSSVALLPGVEVEPFIYENDDGVQYYKVDIKLGPVSAETENSPVLALPFLRAP